MLQTIEQFVKALEDLAIKFPTNKRAIDRTIRKIKKRKSTYIG